MSKAVIKVENLSKHYIIGHETKETFTTFRDVIAKKATQIVYKTTELLKGSQLISGNEIEEFWALKDINLKIQQGERLGIIGGNGAGKSTLLKVLSRITEPTKGRVQIYGRVASLLEVGTGFHPELSGRENIYLNGAILGMNRSEIKNKFDEIVDFSGVEKFLDTPVKRYSSGMYVRLAFAVAAHLEPEILLVDEVLAVGDAAFQKKCLGKMQDVSEGGRTVIFVSHNMHALRQLCNRSILLSSGMIVMDDETSKVVENYLQIHKNIYETKSIDEIIQNLVPDSVFKFEGIRLTQNSQPIGQVAENGKPLEIEIKYRVFKQTTGLEVYFDLIDDQGTVLFRSFHDEDHDGIPTMEQGYYVSTAIIPADFLAPIQYELRILATIYNIRTFYPNGISLPLKIERTGRTNRAYMSEPIYGKLAPFITWQTEQLNNNL